MLSQGLEAAADRLQHKLALVQRLIQALGGRIELGGAKQGLEVRLHLRVAAETSSQGLSQSSTRRPTTLENSSTL